MPVWIHNGIKNMNGVKVCLLKTCCDVNWTLWIIVSQAFSLYAKTWWQVASSTDTRLFPLPVLARARQRPAEGQPGFESTNAVGGHGREGMKEAWEMHNRGLCVGNPVTSGQTERGSMAHKEAETKSNARQKSEEECWSESFGLTNICECGHDLNDWHKL